MLRPTFLAFAALAGATCLAGCADALTFSTSDAARGRIALEEGDHDTAGEIFAEQVRRNPRDYKAQYYLAETRAAADRDVEALRHYRQALDAMPLTLRGQNDVEYRRLIVTGLARQLAVADPSGQFLANYEKQSKGNATLKLLVAHAHAEAGRPDAAMAAFASARAIDRDDAGIAKDYGLYLAALGMNEQAETVLTQAYALNTRDDEVAAALRRYDIVPGPALLSKNDLARPAIPVGPLPEVKLRDPDGDPNRPAPFDPSLN